MPTDHRVFVTGASGYVGRRLVRNLINRGCRVRGLYRHSSEVPSINGLDVVRCADIASIGNWEELISGCNTVVHCAGLAHQTDYQDGLDQKMHRTNAEATENLVSGIRSLGGVERLIFISSVAVLEHGSGRLNEHTPAAPKSAYGHSKLVGEGAVLGLSETSNVEAVVLRPPMIYGPGAPGNLGRLAGLIRRGIPLPFLSINNRRTFMSIDGLIETLWRLVDSPNCCSGTYLVSDSMSLSIDEVCRAIGDGVSRRARLFRVPRGLFTVANWFLSAVPERWLRKTPLESDILDKLIGDLEVDSSKLERLLEWRATIDVSESISRSFAETSIESS